MDVYSLLQQYLSGRQPGALAPFRRAQALPSALPGYASRGPRPDMDELLDYKPHPFQHPDEGIVARPYTGPQTGDPVINRPSYGTWDRQPIDVNNPSLPLWRFWRGW